VDESLSNNAESVPSRTERQATRYYNDAALALDLLYEAALVSPGALQELQAEAERLLQRGTQWRDMKYILKK
jgi:hypothetical protein